uniref:PsbP C-terminal domain-containing protein n=1 Tax=Eutreptiella gymnastica TaxID=73025 RepID=A0A7S1JAB8_9EUGL
MSAPPSNAHAMLSTIAAAGLLLIMAPTLTSKTPTTALFAAPATATLQSSISRATLPRLQQSHVTQHALQSHTSHPARPLSTGILAQQSAHNRGSRPVPLGQIPPMASAGLLLCVIGVAIGALVALTRTMTPAKLSPVAMAATSSHKSGSQDAASPINPRLSALLITGALAMLLASPEAQARLPNPPPGYARFRSVRRDGYDFLIPETWIKVAGAGDTVLFRNPLELDENLFMDISSPSASKYESLADLGSPQDAAKRFRDEILLEFMSTRIGVKREAQVVRAEERIGELDGRQYYDIEIRIQSLTAERELAAYPEERNVILEWDWNFITTVGVANKRLYQQRFKVPNEIREQEDSVVRTVTESFRCFDVSPEDLIPKARY